MVLSYYVIVVDMGKDMAALIIKACGSIIAMVLIWRLVETALLAGIDGMLFFGGMAAIAGLGGYEIRWVADIIRTKVSKGGEK